MRPGAAGSADLEADSEVIGRDLVRIEQTAQQRVLRLLDEMQWPGAVECIAELRRLLGIRAAPAEPDLEPIRILVRAEDTPGNDVEIELLRVFRAAEPYVKTEHALSGPGLLNLHRALAQLRGARATFDTPAAITEAAKRGDALALETVRVFCGWLGSAVGDLVLTYGAFGGVRLAGGVLPQLGELLAASDFGARFLDKGPMRPALERVPVRLIEHGQLGIAGAALWYLENEGA